MLVALAQLRASAVISVVRLRTFSDFSPDDAWNSLLREMDCVGREGGREGVCIAGIVFLSFNFLMYSRMLSFFRFFFLSLDLVGGGMNGFNVLVDEGGGGQVIGGVVGGVLVVGGVRGGVSVALVRWQVLELLVELGPGGMLSED